jgi:hypothetical protein
MSTRPGQGEGTTWRSVPLMWFVVGLPLAVVVAAFVTLGIAIHSSDDVIRDDFRKDGLAIYADPARDAAAAEVGARARLDIDATGAITAALSLERGDTPGELLLVLSHATRAEYDQMVTLRLRDGAYAGRGDALAPGHWYIEITPPGREWRLKGDFRDSAAGLQLAAPGVS